MAFSKKYLDSILEKGKYDKDKYVLLVTNPEERILGVFEKKQDKKELSKSVILFDDADLDSDLNKKFSMNFLKENDPDLPSRIKNRSYKTIKKQQKKAERLLEAYKNILAKKAEIKTRKGKSKATPLNKNPRTETLQ